MSPPKSEASSASGSRAKSSTRSKSSAKVCKYEVADTLEVPLGIPDLEVKEDGTKKTLKFRASVVKLSPNPDTKITNLGFNSDDLASIAEYDPSIGKECRKNVRKTMLKKSGFKTLNFFDIVVGRSKTKLFYWISDFRNLFFHRYNFFCPRFSKQFRTRETMEHTEAIFKKQHFCFPRFYEAIVDEEWGNPKQKVFELKIEDLGYDLGQLDDKYGLVRKRALTVAKDSMKDMFVPRQPGATAVPDLTSKNCCLKRLSTGSPWYAIVVVDAGQLKIRSDMKGELPSWEEYQAKAIEVIKAKEASEHAEASGTPEKSNGSRKKQKTQ